MHFKFKCQVCNSKFCKNPTTIGHIKACPHCGEIYCSNTSHWSKRCGSCLTVFCSQAEYSAHILQACDKCGVGYCNTDDYERHLKYTCSECNNKTCKAINCSICSKIFCNSGEYSNHLIKCKTCDTKFCDQTVFDEHLDMVCSGCGERICQANKTCSICNKVFCSYAEYTNHLVSCSICNKKTCPVSLTLPGTDTNSHFIHCTKCNQDLCPTKYKETHKECTYCKNTFCSEDNYNNHKTTKCNDCGKAFCPAEFSTGAHYKYHCSKCGISTCLESVFNEHIKNICTDCGRKFCDINDYNDHFKFVCNSHNPPLKSCNYNDFIRTF